MRVLVLGVSAIALSGCSWLSGGYSYNNQGYVDNGHTAATYAPAAQKPLSKFAIHGGIGTDFIVGGNGVTGNDTPGAVNVHQRGMQDFYKPGYRAEGGITYALNRKQHLTMNGFYQEAKGKADVPFANVPGQVVTGQMSDYKAYGFEAGLRHDLGKTKMPLLRTVLPYMEGRIGIAKTNDLSITDSKINGVSTGVFPAAATTAAMYEGRLVPTAAALVGVEKPLGRHLSVGLESGLRYIGESNPDDSSLAGTVFSEMNNGSDRWSVPVQLRARYRF